MHRLLLFRENGLQCCLSFATQLGDGLTQIVNLLLLFVGHPGSSISGRSKLHAFQAFGKSLLLAGPTGFLLFGCENVIQLLLQLGNS